MVVINPFQIAIEKDPLVFAHVPRFDIHTWMNPVSTSPLINSGWDATRLINSMLV